MIDVVRQSQQIFDAEARYLAPGTQSVALFSRLCMDRGEGAVLWDVDGNRYVALLAGVGVASLGYAHPRYVAEMTRQLERVHVGSFTSQHRADLVKLIASIAPGDLNRTQLYSSGAEAVEAAVRLARAATGRHEIMGFWGGFHGKTGGVLPLLSGSFKHGLGPLMPGNYSSPYASCARCAFDKTFPSCHWHCVDFVRSKIALETTNDIAAIIVEPIQGTAGNIVPPPGYLRELQALAHEIGALLICDEMITGFGRTGRMFAVEHDSIVPNVLLVGKGFGGGFPVSGIVIREPIAFSKPWANPSGSSSSYGGNPLAAAAAHVTIETIIEEELIEHSRRLGGLMLVEMERWENEIPIVSDVRGRGLMLGMDLVVPGTRRLLDKKVTRWIFDTLLARGVIAMIYNPEVRINPPLVITDEQAMEALGTVKAVLEEAAERVRESGPGRRGVGGSALLPAGRLARRARTRVYACIAGCRDARQPHRRARRRAPLLVLQRLDQRRGRAVVHRVRRPRQRGRPAGPAARDVNAHGPFPRRPVRQSPVREPLRPSRRASVRGGVGMGRRGARARRAAVPHVPGRCGGLPPPSLSLLRGGEGQRAGSARAGRSRRRLGVGANLGMALRRLRAAPSLAVPADHRAGARPRRPSRSRGNAR